MINGGGIRMQKKKKEVRAAMMKRAGRAAEKLSNALRPATETPL